MTAKAKYGYGKPRFGLYKAARYRCLDCSAGSKKEVRLCPAVDCSLWEYRFGDDPTEEIAAQARQVQDVFGRDK